MGFPTWVVAAMLLVLVTNAATAQEENCNFLDEHLERAIDSFIQKLPQERPETVEKGSEPQEELNLIEFKFVNLNSLRPFGPYLTFCRNGSKFVQFDLVNRRPLFLIGSFNGNDSKTHQMESRALLVRFTAQFEVEGTKEDLKLHPVVNLPVSMVGVTMVFKSLDSESKEEIGTFIGLARPSFAKNLWHGMLYSELEKLFAEILPKK